MTAEETFPQQLELPFGLKEQIITNIADEHHLTEDELKEALGSAMDLTPHELWDFIIDTIKKTRRSMHHNDVFGPGREAKIGQNMIRLLKREL